MISKIKAYFAKKKADKKEKLSRMTQKQRKKHRLLKVIKILLIVFVLLLVGNLLMDKLLEPKEKAPIVQDNDEEFVTYNFEEPNWDRDLSNYEPYNEVNSTVMFKTEYGTFPFDMLPSVHQGHKFFNEYFEMLKKGDYEKYPSLFDKSYKTNENFEKDLDRVFPSQMVYDIVITEESMVTMEDTGNLVHVYEVVYKIYQNDGLFRKDIGYSYDIGRDVSRALKFELVTTNPNSPDEKTTIKRMYTKASIN